MRSKRSIAVAAAAATALAGGVAAADPPEAKDGFKTAVKPYAKGVPGSGWVTEPIISADDKVPETGNPGAQYRMVGIPDGLGVERAPRPRPRGEGRQRGARVDDPRDRAGGRLRAAGRSPRHRGAFASQYLLNRRGEVISARRAFERVYQDSTLVGPTADESNTTPAFSRWCSAFLAGRRGAWTARSSSPTRRPVRTASGGTQPPTQFNPKGSQSVAIFDQEAHALSKLGHFPRENTIVMRGTGNKTVILATEDGPRSTDSQLYLYVGTKDRSSSDPLRRNGLDNGKLYALASDDARDDENQLLQGDTLHVHWAEIPGPTSSPTCRPRRRRTPRARSGSCGRGLRVQPQRQARLLVRDDRRPGRAAARRTRTRTSSAACTSCASTGATRSRARPSRRPTTPIS